MNFQTFEEKIVVLKFASIVELRNGAKGFILCRIDRAFYDSYFSIPESLKDLKTFLFNHYFGLNQ